MANQILQPATPIADPRTGRINEYWWRFFLSLFEQLGGENPVDLEVIKQNIADLQVDVESESPYAAISTLDNGIQNLGQSFAGMVAPVSTIEQPILDGMAYPLTVSSLQDTDGLVPVHGLYSDPLLHDVATTVNNGFMSASDKLKLNNIPAVVAPQSIISDVTATNSTADVPILSLTFPANSLVVGSTIFCEAWAVMTSALSQTLNVWVKYGAAKILSIPVTFLAASNQGMYSRFTITVRATGATGTSVSFGRISAPTGLLASSVYSASSATIDTTSSNSFTIGVNWSAASASNIARTINATIWQAS